jgi:Ni/Fe-hydrogenase subunit HybB-like protein
MAPEGLGVCLAPPVNLPLMPPADLGLLDFGALLALLAAFMALFLTPARLTLSPLERRIAALLFLAACLSAPGFAFNTFALVIASSSIVTD